MNRKYSITTLIVLFIVVFSSYSQNVINYKLIDSIGESFTNNLKNGNIENLKNAKRSEGTYTYDRLVEYKNSIKNPDKKVITGSFVEISKDSTYGAFNLFAYRRVDAKSFEYYFAAIVSIDLSGDSYSIGNTYLFTEPEPLKSWWMHVFGFYETESNKTIPKEFVFPVCPPPPFTID